MRCPRCNRVVPDSSPTCPACGEDLLIEPIDPAQDMLWDNTPAEEVSAREPIDPAQDMLWDNTPVEEVPAREIYTSARGTHEMAAQQPPPAPASGRQAFGDGLQAGIATHIVEADPEKDRNTRIVEVSVPAVVRRAAEASAPGPPSPTPARRSAPQEEALDRSIEQMGESISMFYARMHRVDRIAFWLNLATFVAAFLPWRYALGEGLRSGIEGLGAASAGGALLVGLCIYARTARRRLAGLVLLAQLVLAAGVVAVPVYQFFYVPGLQFHVGLYATAVLGAGVIVLTFARMAVRSF